MKRNKLGGAKANVLLRSLTSKIMVELRRTIRQSLTMV